MCSHSHEHHCCGHTHAQNHILHGKNDILSIYKAEIFSALLLVVTLIIEHCGVLRRISEAAGCAVSIPEIILYAIALIPVGLPILRESWEMWRKGRFMNEFTLMVAAAIGAFIIGEYPEGVAVLLFYSFGEKMEDTASDDVRQRIRALLGRLPEEATVRLDGKLKKASPKNLQPGSVLFVRPGERVAIDSILLGEKDVEFDTSAITGESVPRSFRPGEEISSGMIPVDQAVDVRTLRSFSDSSMSRIMKMIEEAQASKSPTENLLRRITRWYTPVVFTLALLLFFTPWLIDAVLGNPFEWMKWLRRSLVFLVCSCPCALVVSIPLSYFASLGNASRRGILFKGSKYVDSLRNIDTVVFDKTGTLTTGKFHVSSISAADGTEPSMLLSVAASLDAESGHPLAEAILSKARAERIVTAEAENIRTVSHGITGIIGGKMAAAGSRTLMRRLGIAVPESHTDASEICVSLDNSYIGSIYLLDTIKPEAAEAIRRLHSLGVKSVEILSGDREEAVKRVARETGADSYHAALLPEDKKDIITEMTRNGNKVAFSGDGINDAPAIAAADVGIAMGTLGTDMAMESSDIVIAGDNLEKIPEAISLARKVRRVILENVTFAIGVKALVMLLGAFGIASLWAAVFADTGVTLLTIIWTLLRLRK